MPQSIVVMYITLALIKAMKQETIKKYFEVKNIE